MTKTIVTIGACATLLSTGAALALLPVQLKCQAGKNLAAGNYAY